MDASSPDGPVSRGPHVAVLAGGALIAGLVAGVVGTLLVRLVIVYWRWVVALLVLGVVAAVAMAVAVVRQRRAERERERRLREIAHLERVDVMTGEEFEELTAELLRRDGFRSVQVVGRTGDRGVDVLATTPDGRDVAVQCKRQKKKVDADRVRNLIGALQVTYPGRLGVLVTNNDFTAPAVEEAAGRLLLVDRARLARWMDGDLLPL